MQDCAHISDGYTVSAYMAGVPKLYPPMFFRFRPTTADEANAYVDATQGKGAREEGRAAAKFVTGKLVKWDLVDAGGKAVPISEASVSRLHVALQRRLFLVVIGAQPWDDDPQASTDTSARQAGDALQESDRGN